MAIAAGALLTTQCDDDKVYYEENGPEGKPLKDPGEAFIGDDDTEIPDSIPFLITGDDGEVIDEIHVGDSIDLDAGIYFAVAVNPRTGLVIDGTEVTRQPDAQGIVALDHNFEAGCVRFIVNENQVTNVKVNIGSMTRLLNIGLTLDGVAPSDIEKVEATVKGVATSVDVYDGFGDVNAQEFGTLKPPYTATAVTDKFVQGMALPVRMLGIADTQAATLTINIALAGGKTKTVDIPAAEALKTFNAGPADSPATIDVEIRLAVDQLTGTITGWKMADDVDGKVNY